MWHIVFREWIENIGSGESLTDGHRKRGDRYSSTWVFILLFYWPSTKTTLRLYSHFFYTDVFQWSAAWCPGRSGCKSCLTCSTTSWPAPATPTTRRASLWTATRVNNKVDERIWRVRHCNKLNRYMQYLRAHLDRVREEELVSSGSRANHFLVFGRGDDTWL